ncbi:cell wall-associated NlpC family hydrolase [Rhizobium rosettiformans]|uniref:Uncharacterized protein n=2 Tax=Rhizobium rosettiformans TaxID=1368430 RepID=A0A4S8PPR8_9HYPH|nr:hypothetical protein [Rhizobium rosettiformans]MBB5277775.1 cell wall-associated NlpC family hydrolase [Rhizobium rosettiformans]THV32937.1 hypothetical protein FAA86_18780 [Rhizobium rosettiformans W3]
MTSPKKVTIYDLENKPHRMTPLNARDMQQHNGWTFTPVDRAALAKAEAAEAADYEQEGVTVDIGNIEKELNGKTKAEMIALAAERFNVRINGRKSESEVIKAIIDAAKAASADEADTAADGQEGNQDGAGDDEGDGEE